VGLGRGRVVLEAPLAEILQKKETKK
jgi:hypothetical protein